MPSLRELDARLKRYEIGVASRGHGRRQANGEIQWGGFEVDTFVTVETLAEAQGVWFDCPECWIKWKAGALHGPHGVLVWWDSAVPERLRLDSTGKPVTWQLGACTGLDDLILTPSIALNAGPTRNDNICRWHGFVGSSGVPPGHAA